jgi:hypothetical protein
MATTLAPRVDESLFKRWGHRVVGWYSSPYELEDKPGVFVIATQGFQHPFVLDVGESPNIRDCVLSHERRAYWRRNALGGLLYAALYTETEQSPFLDEFHRRNIESHIRSVEQPVFGTRDLFARPQESF